MDWALELAGAPSELISWLVDTASDDEAWDSCDKPDWLIWMAGSLGLPLEAILAAGCDCVAQAIATIGAARAKPLRRALAAARHGEPPDVCQAAAEACDNAVRGAPSYRTTPERGLPAARRAAAWIARAAEALSAAHARIELDREQEALHRGLAVGLTPGLFKPAPVGPLVLQPEAIERDPLQQELAYLVAAVAQASHASALALAADDSAAALEEAEGALSDVVHEQLTPLREQLQSPSDAPVFGSF
jgi:hypothetical protein